VIFKKKHHRNGFSGGNMFDNQFLLFSACYILTLYCAKVNSIQSFSPIYTIIPIKMGKNHDFTIYLFVFCSDIIIER